MNKETVIAMKLMGLTPTIKKCKTPMNLLAKKIRIIRGAKTISDAKYMLRVLEGLV